VGSESVKGVLLLGAAVAARRLRDGGRISPEALEARLEQGALELLDKKIEIASWYPVAHFCDLVELNWDVAGKRDPQFLVREGAESANRLFEGGRYQQLDFAERSKNVESRDQLVRQARLIMTLTSTFYNFLDVRVQLDDEQLTVFYGDATAFRDPLIYTTIGFQNQINVRQGSKRSWTGSRTKPDEITFVMPLPKRLKADG